jgi:holo-[acyl-carrier protein] synthase
MRLGLDLLMLGELDRLLQRRWFGRFAFAAVELAEADTMAPDRRREFLAGRFAAKEAVLKVLGAGLFDGVRLADIVLLRQKTGAPEVVLYGTAERAAAGLRISAVSVSITHKQDLVAAVAVGW